MNPHNSKFQLLVVDDEDSLREFLTIMLHREGYQVDAIADARKAVELLRSKTYDLVISDVKMPGMNGIELLDTVKRESPETIVVMMTAFSSAEDAVDAMKRGAYDYIVKPFDNDELRLVIQNALERRTLRQENVRLKKELKQQRSLGGMIGKSKVMLAVYDLIEKVADSRVSILITGESGTGKELAARAIHYNSRRQDRPFIAVNCGAIPENLLESEIFGHEKGAFTGANQQKRGLFEEADGGTLFLDEIGELPLLMQVKMLRVLQDGEVRRVGGNSNIKCDVRLLTATNKTLDDEVKAGRFREDLYYRLNVIHLHLPPLRERRDDLPLLIEHFYRQYGATGEVSLDDQVLRRFLDYPWPGNVRELGNVIERCLILGRSERISADCLPPQLLAAPMAVSQEGVLTEGFFDLDAHLAKIEKTILVSALKDAGGVRKKAAERLGMSFRSIRYRLAKYGLDTQVEDEG